MRELSLAIGRLAALALMATSLPTASTAREGRAQVGLAALKARAAADRLVAVRMLVTLRPVTRDTVAGLAGVLADTSSEVRDAARSALRDLASVEGFSEAATGISRSPQPIKVSLAVPPKKAKAKGKVMVEFEIDSDGHVANARVVESVPGLDHAALECARSWLFAPALQDGRLTNTKARAPIHFRR
jgi:TonB family protein